MGITTITWNVGGVCFLRTSPSDRTSYKQKINNEINELITTYNPDVLILQEVVRYEEGSEIKELIEVPQGYYFKSSIAINSIHQNHPLKWSGIREQGCWDKTCYLGQGNAILWKKELKHSSIWELDKACCIQSENITEEKVRIDTGLFTGYRDTEPRLSVVCHFVKEGRDIFIVNVHLTTLRGEREGLPAIDRRGSRVRQHQISVILEGIVSRYNEWRKDQQIEEPSQPPLWILAGDFNATPDSEELQKLQEMSFLDIAPVKGLGTKRKKSHNYPTITVDYIFAGPTYHAFDPNQILQNLSNHEPDYRCVSSDHYPVIATMDI